MKTQLIMLNTPIIVSDEKIKAGDGSKVFWKGEVYSNGITSFTGVDFSKCQKIIAGIEGLPSIDWNGLEKEFGWVDVKYICESLVDSKTSAYIDSSYRKTLEKYTMLGFKKAQSLNEKKFSLDRFELADLIRKSYLIHGNDSWVSIAKDVIENLSKPKVFDIEIETKKRCDKITCDSIDCNNGCKEIETIPKITNNSIKILRKI